MLLNLPNVEWPYLRVLIRIGLALFTGLLVGLERERRAKEAGLRTFAFASILGCLGGLLGTPYALAALGVLTVLVVLVNLDHLRQAQSVELTTSAAILVMGFGGILCGQGHTLTPVAVAVITTALLAWKTPMSGFSLGLTEVELRAAILFALLAFVIYPALPEGSMGPLGAIEPRAAWLTVLLLAGISFVNYVLWKVYGSRGVVLAGFLGGLMNSTVTVGEMASKVKETGGHLAREAQRGILLATSAMLLRNAALLALLSPSLLATTTFPLALMLLGTALAFLERRRAGEDDAGPRPHLELGSPFSLLEVLRFGLIFLALQVGGIIAHRFLGQAGVYATAILGGLVSSASAVAALAAMGAKGVVSAREAGQGVVVACLASVLINLPLLARSGDRAFMVRTGSRTLLVVALGLAGVLIQGVLTGS